jgi:hypothetical protein
MLTERRQKQIIRDVMNGLTMPVDVEQLSETYQLLWGVVEVANDYHEAYDRLLRAKWEAPDLKDLIDEILTMEGGYSEEYETLADIGPTLQEVEWFWENWIPRGLLSVLAAEPGVGKTNVALDLARRSIANLPAPDGSALQIGNGRTIYLDAEGFLSVIYARCHAWGMNLKKFYPIRRPAREVLDLNTQQYQDLLIDMCYDLKPDLIIVDSLSTVSTKGENSVEDMRQILNFLADVASNFRVALVMIHHLRKEGNNGSRATITQNDLRGSGHIAMMARSLLGLHMANPTDPNGPRKLRVLKTNLCPYPKPLLMAFVPLSNDPSVSLVDYGEVKAPEIPETATGECAGWLKRVLAAGPKTYSVLAKMGANRGYNETLIQCARKVLDWEIVDTKGPKVKGNRWMLHGWQPAEVVTETSTHGSQSHVWHPPLNFEWGGVTHGPCDPCVPFRANLTNQKLSLLQFQP